MKNIMYSVTLSRDNLSAIAAALSTIMTVALEKGDADAFTVTMDALVALETAKPVK